MSAHDNRDVLETAHKWARERARVAFGVVLTTWGSAPRPAGSLIAMREDGMFAGSVSGGCIEADVITRAQDVIATGTPQRADYGVSNDKAWEAGLACGGKISVYLFPLVADDVAPGLSHKNLASLLKACNDKTPTLLTTNLASGTIRVAPAPADTQERARIETLNGAESFIQPFLAPLRLLLVGAAHIADPLSRMAALAGYEVMIIDPRPAFCDAARFEHMPRNALLCAWPDDALKRLAPDARTAIAALSHDPKIDDPALLSALALPLFYIGALGSRTTHAARCERLRAAGIAPDALARIHAPIGLAIGAQSPSEIAVSILAQITQARAQ